jgi:hypothetical protein
MKARTVLAEPAIVLEVFAVAGGYVLMLFAFAHEVARAAGII